MLYENVNHMKLENPELLSAIAAWITGNADHQESSLVQEWLSADINNQKILDYLSGLEYIGEVDTRPETREKVYRTIRDKMARDEEKTPLRRMPVWRYVAAASVIAVFLLAGHYIRKGMQEPATTDWMAVQSGPAATRTVTLPDGSEIILNAGSKLLYPENFTNDERRVQLEGEALFDVTSDHRNPFVVMIGDAEVKVLGTRFNVKGYTDETKITTTLIEGSVSFRSLPETGDAFVLKPNQQIVYEKTTGNSHVSEVDAELFASWTDGVFYFDNENLGDIALKLERGFNIHIVNQTTQMTGERFSGMFDEGVQALQILDMLKRHRAFDYQIQNDTIILIDK